MRQNMLNARSVNLSYDDFRVWRGFELLALRDYVSSYLPNAVIVPKRVTVHDATLEQLNARQAPKVADSYYLGSTGPTHV